MLQGGIPSEALKAPIYGLIDVLTSFRGIRRTVCGEVVRFPARWCRYYEVDYEAPTFDFLRTVCRPGQVVLDVGAHIGLFSVVIARSVGSAGRVFSFEPTPETRGVLESVVRLNGVQDVVAVRPEAVAECTGFAEFHSVRVAGANSNSLVRTDRHESVMSVPTTNIDDFVAGCAERCDLVKIDAEGAELAVLRGAMHTLRTLRPSMWLALHPASLVGSGASLRMIWELLEDAGMRVRRGHALASRDWFCGQSELFDVAVVPAESNP